MSIEDSEGITSADGRMRNATCVAPSAEANYVTFIWNDTRIFVSLIASEGSIFPGRKNDFARAAAPWEKKLRYSERVNNE